jgi:hypothetical protein
VSDPPPDPTKTFLARKIDELRRLPYEQLQARVGKVDKEEFDTGDGGFVALQIMGFWDDRKKGHVRILVNADDGGLRAFMPRSDSFIVAPDGKFIGE